MDTRASTHMSNDPSILNYHTQYTSNDSLIEGNGVSLPITYSSILSTTSNIHLLYVLIIRHLTKNMLSISKLTSNFTLLVAVTNNFVIVYNRQAGRVVAIGKHDGVLYVLEHSKYAFLSIFKIKSLHTSFDL